MKFYKYLMNSLIANLKMKFKLRSSENENKSFETSSFNTGLTDVMRFLIDQGAEVDTGNGLGLTPLLVAVLNGNFEAAKVKLN